MRPTPYCENEMELIRSLKAHGSSAQEIAQAANARFGRNRTRNGVLGLLHRKPLNTQSPVPPQRKPKIDKRTKGRPEKGTGVVWTAEMDAVIVRMWNDGRSTNRMAQAMKAEFGQVMTEWTVQRYIASNMARLGIQDRGDLRKRNGQMPKSKKGLKAPTKAPVVDRTQIDGTAFDDLAKDQCRFPLTDRLPHLFCKSKQEHDSRYCGHHLAICNPEHPAINPNPKPKKAIRV